MQLIRGMHNLLPMHKGCVVSIGNFDGVHRGHQTLLASMKAQADALGLRTCIITFEPHPKAFIHGGAPSQLTGLRDKLCLLSQFGVDQVLCLPFNDALKNLSADEFVQRILVDGLGVKSLIVGDDFRYGRGREGDFAHLSAAGVKYGFSVLDTQTVVDDQHRVSSTRIREALRDGDLTTAEQLLNHPMILSGTVTSGKQLGRQLGFPTANIRLNSDQLALQGVFAVTVMWQGQRYNGVANVGTRPSVNGVEPLLEVHILDFSGDLYQQKLQVTFVSKIRDEQKFASLDALRAAINHDAATARALLTSDK